MLSDGSHSLTATATNSAGTSPASEATTVTISAAGESTPTIPATPNITVPENGAEVSTSLPVVSGTGDPGSHISLIESATTVGTTATDEDGNWSLTPSTPLSDGAHTLSAVASNAAGSSSASQAISISVNAVPDSAPAAPVITASKRNIQILMDDSDGSNIYQVSASCKKGKRKTTETFLFFDREASFKRPKGKRCKYRYRIIGNDSQSPQSAIGR